MCIFMISLHILLHYFDFNKKRILRLVKNECLSFELLSYIPFNSRRVPSTETVYALSSTCKPLELHKIFPCWSAAGQTGNQVFPQATK